EAVGQVHEQDVAVVGVNAFFHLETFCCCIVCIIGSHPGKPSVGRLTTKPGQAGHFPTAGKPEILARESRGVGAISPLCASCRRSRGCSSLSASCRARTPSPRFRPSDTAACAESSSFAGSQA